MVTTSRLDLFRQEIEKAGLTPPATNVADSEIHRFASNGDRTDPAGWYVFHGDGLPAGSFGCFRSNLTQKWCGKSEKVFTQQERLEHRKRIEAMQRQREAAERQQHAAAARRAQAIWGQAAPATPEHPYLQRKGIQPHGLRVDDENRLIVPVTLDGAISSLQFIPPDPDIKKLFLYGGAVKGGSCTIGDLTAATTMLLCEGFATGASLHEATGLPVVAALFAGNLTLVAKQLRQQFPTATIVVCGDNDIRDDETPNTGLEAATAAANAIHGVLAIPEVINNIKTDWNDIHVQRGLDAVKVGIQQVMIQEESPTMATETPNEPLRCTDVGNGELFAQQHRKNVRYCYGLKQWFVWDG